MKRELYGLIGGIAVTVIIGILSLILGSYTFFSQATGWIGFSALILGAVLSGALVSGDRMRLNTAIETKQDRKNRIDISGTLLLFCLPILGAYAFMFFIVMR